MRRMTMAPTVHRVGSSRFRACAALTRVADDIPRRIAGPAAVRPRDCNQRHEKEFLQVSNEETPTTEQPRALALAMRAGGRKKAAPKKKAGRKAAPKKAAAKKKAAARRARRQEGRTEEGRPQGRREEEGRCEEGRRTEEGGGPQEGRRSQEGARRGSGRELDAVGRFRFHELKSCRSRLPSWSRAATQRAPSRRPFLCGGLSRPLPERRQQIVHLSQASAAAASCRAAADRASRPLPVPRPHRPHRSASCPTPPDHDWPAAPRAHRAPLRGSPAPSPDRRAGSTRRSACSARRA